MHRNSKGWPMKDLIYRLDTALVSSDSKKLLHEAAQALTMLCSELESLRADWTRLKMLYEIDGPPYRSTYGYNAHIYKQIDALAADMLKNTDRQFEAACDSES
jgi:hypothetical protein